MAVHEASSCDNTLRRHLSIANETSEEGGATNWLLEGFQQEMASPSLKAKRLKRERKRRSPCKD